ncbi:MAG TPA: hypothetical protein VMY37_36540 [Thermoguttaceae bacterium]|nr:hypothetical protein [Thermoguttaceae bacterium]
MAVSDALHDWEQLASSGFELRAMREKVRDLETVHDTARADFENGLEELVEEEREAILSIMAIYDQCSPENVPSADTPGRSSAKNSPLSWLVAKVGNEGSEGVTWGDVLEAWTTQFPDAPSSTLYSVLHQGRELFNKTGLGRKAVLRLTSEGQAVFRDAK